MAAVWRVRAAGRGSQCGIYFYMSVLDTAEPKRNPEEDEITQTPAAQTFGLSARNTRKQTQQVLTPSSVRSQPVVAHPASSTRSYNQKYIKQEIKQKVITPKQEVTQEKVRVCEWSPESGLQSVSVVRQQTGNVQNKYRTRRKNS